MKKAVAGTLILYFWLFAGTALAGDVVWFGPKQYTRTKGKPDIYTNSFQARITSAAKIFVTNGDGNGLGRITSAKIMLNGAQLFGPKDFNQHVANLSAQIDLKVENILEVELKSNSGDHPYLTITILLPEPEAFLSTEPIAIVAGQSATLSWKCTEADSCIIEPGMGEVDPSGTLEVSPSETTTYTLTATSIVGSAKSSSSITVVPAPGSYYQYDELGRIRQIINVPSATP